MASLPHQNSPRVLYIIGQLGRGGAEQQLYNLLSHLQAGEATVLSLSPGGYWANPIRELGYTVIELPRRSHLEWKRLYKVFRIIKQVNPEIVMLFTDGISGMYARIGILLARNYPLIVCERSHPTLHPAWLRSLLPVMNRYAQGIICNSYSSFQYMINNKLAPKEKVYYIPNSIENDRFASKYETKNRTVWPSAWREKVIVGTVGHLTPVKNPEYILQVAKRIIQYAPDTRFVLIGDGKLRAPLQRKITEYNLERIVFLAGEQNDIPDLLQQMDVFLLTSIIEGMPNSLVEAMASGLPCVTTDVGDCGKLVTESGAGAVFAPENLDGMVQYLLKLVSDLDYRRTLGQRGRIYSEDFTPGKMANRFLSVYEQVLHGNYRKAQR